MDINGAGYNRQMPPPKKAEKDKRQEFVKVYLTVAEKTRLAKQARVQGLSLAAYARMVLVTVTSSSETPDTKA